MFFNPEECRNEREVESKFIVQYLLPALGYAPEGWNQEVSFGNIRLDFLVFTAQILPIVLGDDSPLSLVVEAKSPRHNLNPHVEQIKRYLITLRSPYGLLTNGKDFRIFERKAEDIKLVFQCKGSTIEANFSQIKAIIGREEILQRRLGITPAIALSTTTQLGSTELITPEIDRFSIPLPILEIPPEPTTNQQLSKPQGEPRMKTIAIYHNKGGVGKTTTVVNLAAALSKQGKKVLIIDLDSQANTTFATGLVKFQDEADDTIKDNNISQLLSYEEAFPIKEVARPTDFCNPTVDVIPSHIDLMSKENDLNSLEYSRLVLIQKLQEVAADYDITLIDTPPSLNLYARIALISADYLIIPSDLKPFANQGLNNVKGLIKDVNGFRKMIGRQPLQVLGVLATKISTNFKFGQSTLPKRMQVIMERYEFEVMESIIFEREDLAKCAEIVEIIGDTEIPNPRSVLDFKPGCDAAQEFNKLALEVLSKVG
jgi:chromosome partitioning protein